MRMKRFIIVFLFLFLLITVLIVANNQVYQSPGISFNNFFVALSNQVASYNMEGLTNDFEGKEEWDPNAEPYIPYNPYNPWYPFPLDEDEMEDFIENICDELGLSEEECDQLKRGADCFREGDYIQVTYDLLACMTYIDDNGRVQCTPFGMNDECRKILLRHRKELNELRQCLGAPGGNLAPWEHWDLLLQMCREIEGVQSEFSDVSESRPVL